MHVYKPGDWVIYRKQKHSSSPGPRAREISPEPRGEEYSYLVDKFWVVVQVESEEVTLVTRRGKRHHVRAGDPRLRVANWWEKLFYRHKFPSLADQAK